MKRMLLALTFLLAPTSAWPAGIESILWLKLTPSFTYMDLDLACTNFSFPSRLYFGANISKGKVLSAVIKREPLSSASAPKVAFTAEEAQAIELEEDKMGRLWVKSLPVPERVLIWIFSNASPGVMECRPPRPLKSVVPAPYTYVFESNPETLVHDTPLVKFSGENQKGEPYSATLQLKQEPIQ